MSKYQRVSEYGQDEYSDGHNWFGERNVCRHCSEERETDGKPYRWADEQYSFGVYAGRYCDVCWPKSGYRDAVNPDDCRVEDLHEFEAGGYAAIDGE